MVYTYQCSVEGCEKQARGAQDVCLSHGAIVKRCSVDGCNNHRKQIGGLCKRHHKENVLHSIVNTMTHNIAEYHLISHVSMLLVSVHLMNRLHGIAFVCQCCIDCCI